jgi:hypothetical protein
MDRKEGGDAERRCEPAPYHMADVGNSLARNAKLVVQTVRARCSPDDHLFYLWRRRITAEYFLQFTKSTKRSYRHWFGGAEDDINFVLSIPQLLKRRRSLSPH